MQKVLERIRFLEREIAGIKQAIAPARNIDFSIDEKNWSKLRNLSKKVRKQLLKETYPRLYAKLS